MLSVEQVIE